MTDYIFGIDPAIQLLNNGLYLDFVYFVENGFFELNQETLQQSYNNQDLISLFLKGFKERGMHDKIMYATKNKNINNFTKQLLMNHYPDQDIVKDLCSNGTNTGSFCLYLYSKGFDLTQNNNQPIKSLLNFNNLTIEEHINDYDLNGLLGLFIQDQSLETLQNLTIESQDKDQIINNNQDNIQDKLDVNNLTTNTPLVEYLLFNDKNVLAQQILDKGVQLKTSNRQPVDILKSIQSYKAFKVVEKQAKKESWSQLIQDNILSIIQNIPENRMSEKNKITREYKNLTQQSIMPIDDVEYHFKNEFYAKDIESFYKSLLKQPKDNKNSIQFKTPFGTISVIDWFIHYFNENKKQTKELYKENYANIHSILKYEKLSYEPVQGQSSFLLNEEESNRNVSQVAHLMHCICSIPRREKTGHVQSISSRAKILNQLFNNLKKNKPVLSEKQFNIDVNWLNQKYNQNNRDDKCRLLLNTMYYWGVYKSQNHLTDQRLQDYVQYSQQINESYYTTKAVDRDDWPVNIVNITQNNGFSKATTLLNSKDSQQLQQWQELLFDVCDKVEERNKKSFDDRNIVRLFRYSDKRTRIIPDLVQSFFNLSEKGWQPDSKQIKTIETIIDQNDLIRNQPDIKQKWQQLALNTQVYSHSDQNHPSSKKRMKKSML